MSTFRSLSQTCRRLRAVALPQVWEEVHVTTVRRLGLLRDILREQPDIASWVRVFAFSWNMKWDYCTCEPYAEEYGSLLDMAFMDRGAVWEEHRQRLRARPLSAFFQGNVDDEPHSSFVHNGVVYIEPGGPSPGASARAAASQADAEAMADPIVRAGYSDSMERKFFPYAGPNINRSGPDGKGQDLRIRNVQEFNDSLVEIVAQLQSLDTFAWQCPVTPMPVGVFRALKNGKKLASLKLDMDCKRKNVHACKFKRSIN